MPVSSGLKAYEGFEMLEVRCGGGRKRRRKKALHGKINNSRGKCLTLKTRALVLLSKIVIAFSNF